MKNAVRLTVYYYDGYYSLFEVGMNANLRQGGKNAVTLGKKTKEILVDDEKGFLSIIVIDADGKELVINNLPCEYE